MERKNTGTAPVVCRNWARTGTCTFGARCHFAHYDVQNAIPGSSAQNPNPTQGFGSPARSGPIPLQLNSSGGRSNSNANANANKQTVCRNWATTGNCKFGDRCHFSHSQPSQNFGPVSPTGSSTPPPTPSSTSGRDDSAAAAAAASKTASPSKQEMDQLGQKLNQLEVHNPHPTEQHAQATRPSGGKSEPNFDDYVHPDDEPDWEEGFEEEGDDDLDEDSFFIETSQPTVKDGSSCPVQDCKGFLQPHLNESGALQYYLCSLCGALFTNQPAQR